MNLSLYQIEAEYLELAQRIIDADGEMTPELEQALLINKDQLNIKAANYGFVVKQAEADMTAIDNELARLTAIKAGRTKLVDRLKSTIKNAMELHGYEKIEANTITISFKKSTETVIEKPELVPMKYKTKLPVVYSISKKDIKNDIDAGKTVAGAYLLPKKNIHIK